MNLHQFRYIQEASKRNLNLTEVAKALYTSQPGVSKAIIEFEKDRRVGRQLDGAWMARVFEGNTEKVFSPFKIEG